jgi:hypothetical protein
MGGEGCLLALTQLPPVPTPLLTHFLPPALLLPPPPPHTHKNPPSLPPRRLTALTQLHLSYVRLGPGGLEAVAGATGLVVLVMYGDYGGLQAEVRVCV